VVGAMTNTITTAADGAKSGDKDGSIWVWASSENHHKQLMPFAALAEGVVYADEPTGDELDSAVLRVFRNAQDDGTTDNATESWLYGCVEGDKTGFVYWNGIAGSRRVILRKVDSTYAPVPNMTFAIYKGTSEIAYTPKGEASPLSGLRSGASGCIWIGDLPYGWYILEEQDAGKKLYFYLVVTASGVEGTPQTVPNGYANRDSAAAEAKTRYENLK